MTRKILVLRGLQGSGKTTFAKQWVEEDSEHRVRFNRDDVRRMLGKYWVPERETLINDLYMAFLESSMCHGYDIVIDNMNLNEHCLDELEFIVKDFNSWADKLQYEIEVKDFFNVPLETCIERDKQREDPVGEQVIRKTYNRYKDKIAPWKYL